MSARSSIQNVLDRTRDGKDLSSEDFIAVVSVLATIELTEQQKRVADVLEMAQMGGNYGFWVRSVE